MADYVQTSYAFAPTAGLPGQIARNVNGSRVVTSIAAAALALGLIAFTGRACASTTGKAGIMEATAASATALIASGGASSGSIQTIAAADMNGALGAGAELFPPRNVTLTLSSHADWDATTAVVSGTDENGVAVTESLSIPNGGNATVTGTQVFRTITSLVIPAQSGTGGTFTFGVGSSLGKCDHLVEGVVLRDDTKPVASYAAGELVPLGRTVEVFLTSETAVKDGDPVHVRVRAPSGETLGAVRATAVAGQTVLLANARFRGAASAGTVRAEFNLPG